MRAELLADTNGIAIFGPQMERLSQKLLNCGNLIAKSVTLMIKSQADRAWRDDRWMSAIRGEFNRSLLVWLIVVTAVVLQ